MHSTTRRILTVMAVTTALCADHVVCAAPVARPQAVEMGQVASRLVSRLAQRFVRCKPAVFRERTPEHRLVQLDVADGPAAGTGAALHQPTSPFQFRLPPPRA